MLSGAAVTGCEFTGSIYISRLSYGECSITAYSDRKPEAETIDIAVPQDRIIRLKA